MARSRSTGFEKTPRFKLVRVIYTTFIVGAIAVVGYVLVSASQGGTLAIKLPAATTTTTTTAPAIPLSMVQSTPAKSATAVSPNGPFEVTFNEAIQSNTLSSLKTSVSGTWKLITPDSAQFIPSQSLLPETTLTITSPSSASQGVIASNGGTLTSKIDLSWTIENGSILRIQQILANLGYLPYTWTATPGQASETPLQQMFTPLNGTFTPRYSNTPASLLASFKEGVKNHMTTGAIMAFERNHQLPAYESVRPLLWPVLLSGEASNVQNPNGYTYTMVSTTVPETITLWNNGNIVLHTLVNTGIPSLATPPGNFLVYLRYPTQTMRGKNVNGSYYVDHGVKWVNYINGSIAIHGFVRATYGTPQSLGCVELPVSQAAIAWKWLHYGSLVNVA